MVKIIFSRLGTSLWRAHFLVLLLIFSFFYYKTNLTYYNINFIRYIDAIIVFNCNNFENISLSIYPKELVLKNTNSTNFITFLDLKMNFLTNIYLIKCR